MSDNKNLAETDLYLVFRDLSPEMVMGWVEHFGADDRWNIGAGNILQLSGDAIVSPANSYGFMDGGIDLAYRNFFGLAIQRRVQAEIEKSFSGKLPVGEALIILTAKTRIPQLIVAPTMETPRSIVGTDNVYKAMRAALLKIFSYNTEAEKPLRRILIPGMGTGVGKMDCFEAARQMRAAFDDIQKKLRKTRSDSH